MEQLEVYLSSSLNQLKKNNFCSLLQVKSDFLCGTDNNLWTVFKRQADYLGLLLFQDVFERQPAWSGINNNQNSP